MDDDRDLEALLRPGRGSHILGELLRSSAQAPIAIALAVLLSSPVANWPTVIPLLAGAFLQAWVIGTRSYHEQPRLFVAEFIGVALFAAGMAAHDWRTLDDDPFLMVYLVVSTLVALARMAEERLGGVAGDIAIIVEHAARSLALVAIYGAVDGQSFVHFLDDPGHRYLAVGTFLLGCALGFSALVHRRDRRQLGRVIERLKHYSEMLLGRSRLTRAMGRNDDLSPRRTRRTVLFADIRGFTRWSENRPPEEVLSMLDGMFGEAEATCACFNPVRTKHTGDEIMMFFTEPLSAGRAALALRDRIQPRLAPLGLGIGIGIHCGEVIEGLIGSTRTKAYDIIGDTVNTAKRVCDHAGPGKVVITFTVYEASGGKLGIAGDERIMAKGKSTAVLVAELVSVAPEEAQPAQG